MDNSKKKCKILYYSEGNEDILSRSFTVYKKINHNPCQYIWILEEETFDKDLLFELNINPILPFKLVKRYNMYIGSNEDMFFPTIYRQKIKVEANSVFDDETIYAPFNKLVDPTNKLFK